MGGAETHVRDLANSLAAEGHNVHLVSRHGIQQSTLDSRVFYTPLFMNDLWYFFIALWLRSYIRKHNIELVHGHQRMAISLASWAARATDIPSIATIHGQLQYDIRSVVIRKFLDQVICVREETAHQVSQCRYLRNKNNLILNGVSRYPAQYQSTPFNIMYGSRHDKRHAWLICLLIEQVLPRLKEDYPALTLTLWGEGKYSQEIRNTAQKINTKYPGMVSLAGYTTTLGLQYQKADLVIACARSAMDALVAERVTLAANFHHLGELITAENYHQFKDNNFEAKIFERPDAAGLFAKIEKYFQLREHYQASLEKIYPTILQDLTTENSVRKTLDVYHKSLLRKPC